jgi:hypothetical protein
MNWLFLAAAAVSFVTWGIHVFAGGPTVARPVLQTEGLDPVAKHTAYYCWHLVSMVLLAMPLSFLRAAMRPQSRELAVLMSVLAAAFTLWSIALLVWKRQRALDLPQWILFLPIAVLGLLGALC